MCKLRLCAVTVAVYASGGKRCVTDVSRQAHYAHDDGLMMTTGERQTKPTSAAASSPAHHQAIQFERCDLV